MPHLPALLLLCTLLATMPPAAAGQPPAVRLTVNPHQVLAPVNPDVLRGYNFGNWMQAAEFRKQLLELRPRSFRFPGGNVGDEYDMTEDIVKILKVNLDLMNRPEVFFHTRVFQSRPGDPPARNGPADAAASVALARAHGIAVRHWEVGNEPDLFAVTRGDASWTAARYCEVFRAQAQAIRQADPKALVAGPAVSGSVPVRDRFLEAFVHDCGDTVDMLTYHIYPTDGSEDDARALDTVADADDIITRYRALWVDPARNPKGHQRRIRWGVTEYGLSWRTANARHLADFAGAMWATEVALRLNRQGVDVAHYFAFQGTGGHGLLDTAGVPRPSFYAFRLLAGLKGQLVAATSSEADVWAHAVRDGKSVTVLLINKGRDARPVATALPGLQFSRVDYFDESIVEDERPPASLRVAGGRITLPGWSITRLRYRLP